MNKPRYLNLDALRGVAALCVVIYHFSTFFGPDTLIPSAYLAVDFFFVLSGFVIAYAYDARFRDGISLARFARYRLVRLYPLYIAATLLGFLYLIMRGILDPAHEVAPQPNLGLLAGAAAFVPYVSETRFGLYPLDPAAWSVFYELLANFTYWLFFGWLTLRRLSAVAALGALGLIGVVVLCGSLDNGSLPNSAGFVGASARITFSFAMGVMVARLQDYRPAWLMRLAAYARVEVLAVLLVAVFLGHPAGTGRMAYDLCCVLLVFPLVILLGIHTQHRAEKSAVCEFLGRISYPLYILHDAVVLLGTGAYKAVMHTDPLLIRPVSGVALVFSAIIVAALAERFYDAPARRLLSGRLPSRSVVVPTPAVATS